MQDNELRRQFTEWAQPLHAVAPPPISVIRRRARRRTARLAASAMTAAAVVALGALLVTSVVAARPKTAPGLTLGSPFLAGRLPGPDAGPGSAPYYLTLDANLGEPAVVHDINGRTLGRIVPPAGLMETWVASAGDDRTFVLSVINSSGTTWFYEVRLSRAGRPGPLTRLNVPALQDRQVDGLALSADGTELAVASEANGDVTQAPQPQLEVASLATGKVRIWASAGGYPSMLSWAGDRELAFELDLTAPSAVAPLPGSGLRLLDPTAPGRTPLAASRLIVPYNVTVDGAAGIITAQITPDGSVLYVAFSPVEGKNTFRIAQLSARTGKLQRMVLSTGSGTGLGPCGVVWTDASGSHLRVQCGSVAETVDNGVAHSVSPPWSLPDNGAPGPTSYAW